MHMCSARPGTAPAAAVNILQSVICNGGGRDNCAEAAAVAVAKKEIIICAPHNIIYTYIFRRIYTKVGTAHLYVQ